MSTGPRVTGTRRVSTRVGDTLPRVAARELGDAALWPGLAELNGLLPPYLTDDPAQVSDRVLRAGMTIEVPSQAPSANGAATSSSTSDVLGTDIALTDGRLTFVDGDFATVSGAENMVQAIGHAIETRPGELLYHRAYGCHVHDLKGQEAGPVTNRLAASFVRRTILADPRIDRTEDLAASVTGDTIRVTGTARTVDSKRVDVERS